MPPEPPRPNTDRFRRDIGLLLATPLDTLLPPPQTLTSVMGTSPHDLSAAAFDDLARQALVRGMEAYPFDLDASPRHVAMNAPVQEDIATAQVADYMGFIAADLHDLFIQADTRALATQRYARPYNEHLQAVDARGSENHQRLGITGALGKFHRLMAALDKAHAQNTPLAPEEIPSLKTALTYGLDVLTRLADYHKHHALEQASPNQALLRKAHYQSVLHDIGILAMEKESLPEFLPPPLQDRIHAFIHKHEAALKQGDPRAMKQWAPLQKEIAQHVRSQEPTPEDYTAQANKHMLNLKIERFQEHLLRQLTQRIQTIAAQDLGIDLTTQNQHKSR